MLLRFCFLLFEFCNCTSIFISLGLSRELRIHRLVFVGFTGNSELQATGNDLLFVRFTQAFPWLNH